MKPTSLAEAVGTEKNHSCSIEKLANYVKDFKESQTKDDFAEVERQIHSMVMDIEKEALEACLSEFDVDVPMVSIDGELYKKVLRCEQDYQSAAGLLRVCRSLYRKKAGTQTVCPLELKSGIIEGHWTPKAAKQGVFAMAHMTSLESEQMFQEIANMTPSKSSLDRLPKMLGKLWESSFLENQASIRLAEEIPEQATTVSVSLDGVMIPLKDKDGQAGSHYKEASCGTVSLYDNKGERLSTIQLGRMPEHKKFTLKNQLKEELNQLLANNPKLTVVKIADGAKDNWDFLDSDIKEGISLLDFWHMSEHVKEALDDAYRDDSAKSKVQFEKYKTLLKEDKKGPEKLIRYLAYLSQKFPQRTTIANTLAYIRNNKHRMRYQEALSHNLPIGSGVVEACCKTLVTQRMKRSGMRWQSLGGQSILSFRSLIKSERFDHAWDIICLSYKGEVSMPDNVVALPRRG